ncbi:hypothetical protein GN956_G3623 [Arapaima gigas]
MIGSSSRGDTLKSGTARFRTNNGLINFTQAESKWEIQLLRGPIPERNTAAEAPVPSSSPAHRTGDLPARRARPPRSSTHTTQSGALTEEGVSARRPGTRTRTGGVGNTARNQAELREAPHSPSECGQTEEDGDAMFLQKNNNHEREAAPRRPGCSTHRAVAFIPLSRGFPVRSAQLSPDAGREVRRELRCAPSGRRSRSSSAPPQPVLRSVRRERHPVGWGAAPGLLGLPRKGAGAERCESGAALTLRAPVARTAGSVPARRASSAAHNARARALRKT